MCVDPPNSLMVLTSRQVSTLGEHTIVSVWMRWTGTYGMASSLLALN